MRDTNNRMLADISFSLMVAVIESFSLESRPCTYIVVFTGLLLAPYLMNVTFRHLAYIMVFSWLLLEPYFMIVL